MPRTTAILLILAASGSTCLGQQIAKKRSYPPVFADARVETYKQVGDVKLNLYVFTPPNHRSSDSRPAIVFFFGGGWRNGTPAQFEEQCRYLASRGMVAITADYRVSSRHGTKALQCVADGKSAIRWIRTNAARLGVDPNRLAAGGGSAGGHVAACTGTIAGLDEEGEDLSVSSRPDCLVLFNPALVLAPVDEKTPFPPARMKDLEDRMGIAPEALSPYHHVSKGVPPTIIFHGTGDTTVPYATVELFAQRMKKAENTCRLVPFEGRAHGFFNYGRNGGADYTATVRAMDEFLVEQGFLQEKPTVGK